jgi:hypothetical protein
MLSFHVGLFYHHGYPSVETPLVSNDVIFVIRGDQQLSANVRATVSVPWLPMRTESTKENHRQQAGPSWPKAYSGCISFPTTSKWAIIIWLCLCLLLFAGLDWSPPLETDVKPWNCQHCRHVPIFSTLNSPINQGLMLLCGKNKAAICPHFL